jgi:hypothetical protein
LNESLHKVFQTGEPDTLAFIHYEIPGPDGQMQDRYWTAVHTPILGQDGAVEFVLQNTVDVTDWQKAQAAAALPLGATPVGTALLQRAQEAERAQVSAVQSGEEFQRLFRLGYCLAKELFYRLKCLSNFGNCKYKHRHFRLCLYQRNIRLQFLSG